MRKVWAWCAVVGAAAWIGIAAASAWRGDASAQPYDEEDEASGPAMSAADAERTCREPWTVPSRLLRRAIRVAAEHRLCGASDGLVTIVDDAERDVLTRGLAAAALGEIACHQERRVRGPWRRVEGLSALARGSLESATQQGLPAGLRQASTRALGRARSSPSVSVLDGLRADPDPVVRFVAAQSLTRITGEDRFDETFRDDVILDVVRDVSTYSVVDDPEWVAAAAAASAAAAGAGAP